MNRRDFLKSVFAAGAVITAPPVIMDLVAATAPTPLSPPSGPAVLEFLVGDEWRAILAIEELEDVVEETATLARHIAEKDLVRGLKFRRSGLRVIGFGSSEGELSELFADDVSRKVRVSMGNMAFYMDECRMRSLVTRSQPGLPVKNEIDLDVGGEVWIRAEEAAA